LNYKSRLITLRGIILKIEWSSYTGSASEEKIKVYGKDAPR
jgi:hypothetical protein